LVAWLPDKLPKKPTIVWRRALREKGLGGVAATSRQVIVSDRELADAADAFWCLDADTGKELWNVVIPATGHFDFGNSTRSTPLIAGDLVYLTSAFGPVRCVKLSDGETVWERDLHTEYSPQVEPPWGLCGSPLIVDGKLIVSPGAKEASIVALDAKTGATVWKSPGGPSAYGSFMSGRFGGRLQAVGHDADSLGGWDVQTGARLWRLPHRSSKEFGVPTPVAVGDQLLVSTESEGTRLYRFGPGGIIDPRPVAVNEDLAPDSHTPIVVGNRVFGVWGDLFCLDLTQGLKPIWRSDDNAFASYASLIGSPDRALVVGLNGELLLLDARGDRPKILGRMQVFDNDHGVYSHPAVVGTRLYLRGSSEIVCLNLVEG
jgi:outer membrane protein assembly factor BamB